MPLQPQGFELQLNGGLDVKQSADLQDPSSLVVADNLRFNRMSQLERRPTYSGVEFAEEEASDGYANARLIEAIFGNGNQVCALTQHNGVGVVGTDGLVMPKDIGWFGTAPKACRVSRRFVLGLGSSRLDRGVLASSSAYSNELGAIVTASAVMDDDTQARLLVRVIDATTGAVRAEYANVLVMSVASLPYLQTLSCPGSGVVVTYAYGASLGSYAITQLLFNETTNAFDAPLTIVTGVTLGAHALNLASPTGETYYLTYSGAAAATKSLLVDSTDGSVSATHTGTATGVSFSTVQGDGHALIASVADDGSAAYIEIFGTPSSRVTLATPIADATVTLVSLAYQSFLSVSGGSYVVAGVSFSHEIAGFLKVQSTQFYAIRYDTGTLSVGETGTRAHGVVLASHGISFEGVPFFVVNLDVNEALKSIAWTASTEASSAFLVRVPLQQNSGPDPVARICHDRVGIIGQFTQVVALSLSSDGTMYYGAMADPSATPIAPFAVTLPQSVFVSAIEFPNGTALPLSSVTHDGATLVASGMLFDFDGYSTLESQPLSRPRLTTLTTSGSVSGTLSFASVYRMVDTAGRLHRSSPSPALTLTVSSKQIDVYVSKCPLTAYANNDNGGHGSRVVDVELYVTQDGGTTYYLALDGSGRKLTYNALSDDNYPFFVFSDVQPGTPGVELYSTGADLDELPSEPPPSLISVARIADRIWAIDAEDRRRIWYTKPLVAGFAAEWSTDNTLFIGDDGVAVIDNQGIPTMLTNGGVWVVDGDGPNANGVGDFSPAQRLPIEIDGICPTSICRVTGGAFFRTMRGVSLLAGTTATPIGLPIDPAAPTASRNDRVKCVFDERHNEVRVIDEARGLFVYNLVESKWTRWLQDSDNQCQVDACMVTGRVWYVHKSDFGFWTVRRELGVDEANYNLSIETWELETPWLRLDNIAGFGRLWRMVAALHTTGDENEQFGVEIWRDGDESEFIFVGDWADMSQVGAPSDGVVWLRVAPSQQRLTSVKVHLASGPNADPAFVASIPLALRFECGIQSGGRRQLDQRAIKGA